VAQLNKTFVITNPQVLPSWLSEVIQKSRSPAWSPFRDHAGLCNGLQFAIGQAPPMGYSLQVGCFTGQGNAKHENYQNNHHSVMYKYACGLRRARQ
jgi:hypothetical protein